MCVCVFVLLNKENWDTTANVKAQLFVFSVYNYLLRALEIYFHDSLLEWPICHFSLLCVCLQFASVSVRVCWLVGVPTEQFPLMRKVRRRYLGEVMKDLEGNSVG